MTHLKNSSSFITYNCKNIKRSVECVRSLCKGAEVIALQETWLLPHDLAFLGEIDKDFSYTGKSAVDLSTGVLRGRPHGGVAILWRNSAFHSVTVIKCSSERIAAIKVITREHKEFIVICVYMPTDVPDNLPIFTQCLCEINAIIEDNCVENVYMLGDYNAHPSAQFYEEMLEFCNERQWFCADVIRLGTSSGTHTFVSDAHGSQRWLDHCLVSTSAWQTINKIEVLYDVYWSDHYPLKIECNINIIRSKEMPKNELGNQVLWGVRTLEQIDRYSDLCNKYLKAIELPQEFQCCLDNMCNNISHRSVIDRLYYDIINALSKASVESSVDKSHKNILGWNKHVSSSHKQARLDFLTFVSHGKPKSGPIYEKMCSSRKNFKSRLKFCQNNQELI